MVLTITINDTKRLYELVADRVWLCSQLHPCDRCEIQQQCRQLFERLPDKRNLTPAKADRFLVRFEELKKHCR